MVCLFCKSERDESDEHPFAVPFGDVNFIVRFVCKPCNDRLGSEVDSQADLDARLSHARHSAGLPIRPQSIRRTDRAIEPDGKHLRTVFDKQELASVVLPQRDGDEVVVGRDRMPQTIREMLRAQFRKAGQLISDPEIDQVTREVLRKFDEATTGETTTHWYRGLTIQVPRLELENDEIGAQRHDVPSAINRLSGKIALEIAAYALGLDVMLRREYHDLRNWVLVGEPDLSTAVHIIREPAMSGGDAVTEHTVHLEEAGEFLYATISYYDAYVVRVQIGPATGMTEPWERRFPIEPQR